MEAKKIRFAGILLGLVMVLGLMPGLAIADPAATGGGSQTTDSKPLQAIQATSLSVFTSDTGKSLGAHLVEGNGELSYAVKSGSESYIDVGANGVLTIKAAPPNNIAYVTVTAAATNTYAQTSVDVPVKIYESYNYEISFWTVQYSHYNTIYNLNSLDIKLFKGETVVGNTTVENPRNGDKVTVPASNFADRVEMTAHIQLPKRDPFTLTGTGGIGGSINVWNPSSRSGKVFTCNYGMNAPDPEYAAPVAKPNLTANGTEQVLVYPGSVSVGGRIQYSLGTESGPNNSWSGLGYMRAKDPGTYYVYYRTHNTDFYTARYIGQGRSELSPQRIEVTISKGDISPTVDIEGWTYGEKAKTPTVTGNTGNGAVTYEYKVKDADDSTYTTTVPEDAGDYTVRATIADTTSYNGGSDTADFTISKATLPTQDVRIAGVLSSNDQDQVWETTIIDQSLAGMVPGSLSFAAGTPNYKLNNVVQDLPSGFTFGQVTDPDTSQAKPYVNSSTGEVNAILTISNEVAATIESVDQVGEIILPVTVTSQNYEDATINVVVMPTARTEKTVTINGAPTSKTYGDDSFTLTATVEGGETGENNWYWYSSDPQVLAVNAENGSNQMQIHVKNPGSAMILAWYEPADSNDIGAQLTASITVNKATINPSVSINGWTYGGEAATPTVTGNTSNGAVTYSYNGTTLGDTAFAPSATAPTQAGTYTVTATVAETDNYLGATCTKDFTIAPKTITATVTAADKTYDGTTDATVLATVKSSDLVSGDLDDNALVEDGKVTIAGLTGTFADKNVGKDKVITLNYDGLVSPVKNAESYEVTATTTQPTATIEPRPININADDKSSQHSQAIAELTYSPYGSTELAEGDSIESLGITASTTATSSSNVGEYPITLSGGTANANYNVTLGEEGGTYTIDAADISKATIKLAQTSYIYDGEAKEPASTVTLNGKTLVAGTDYDVSYADNTEVGTASITVTGKGNFTGSASASFAIETVPEPAKGVLHRLYNPNSGEHFFTTSDDERDAVVAAGWTYEGEGWTAPESGIPVYRLYNANGGEHHYTKDVAERDWLVSLSWNDEGMGWYSDEAESVPLYRVYNPNAFSNNHHYTANADERDWLVSLGWNDEGIGWYGVS